MRDRIERQPPFKPCRGISQQVRDQSMRVLMNDRRRHDNDKEKNQTNDIHKHDDLIKCQIKSKILMLTFDIWILTLFVVYVILLLLSRLTRYLEFGI